MNTQELREMFEEDLGPKYAEKLTRNAHGMYIHATVRQMWMGYKMLFEKRYHLGEKDSPMIGRWILGTARENGAVLMGRVPYRHKSKALALEEANRLVNEYGKNVYLFRCHEMIFAPKPEGVL